MDTIIVISDNATKPLNRVETPTKKGLYLTTVCTIESIFYRWFSRYVIAAILVDEKKFVHSSFCSSNSNCTLQHCYVSLEIGCKQPTSCCYKLGENKLLTFFSHVFKAVKGQQFADLFNLEFPNSTNSKRLTIKKNRIDARKQRTLPSMTTVSPLITTLLTQPLTFKPANGVHCALEYVMAAGMVHSSPISTST